MRSWRATTRPTCWPSAAAAPLTAAKLIGEFAGAERFATDAKGRAHRGHRADPSVVGQPHPAPARSRRQPPAQLRAAPARGQQGHLGPESAAYLARKQAEGKTRKEALRCLKRHLTRRVWQLLRTPPASDAPSVTIHRNMPTHALALT